MRAHHDAPDRTAQRERPPGAEAAALMPAHLPLDLLTPSGVLRLQRTAGNAAVARMLERRASRVIVQRKGKSAAKLRELAVPKVGEGQSIDVQKDLVDALEPLATQKKDVSELNLGGILIDSLPDVAGGSASKKDEQDDLYAKLIDDDGGSRAAAARFVQLKGTIGAMSAGAPFGDEVKSAGLGPLVVENSLRTMIDAGQFDYLRLAGIPNKDWKILVEVHYIRSRPKDMAGFRKDTKGQSLFVNLNYHVEGRADDEPERIEGKAVRGPEYVINPPPSEEHDALIMGTDEKAGTLPKRFTDDLQATRAALGEPTEMKSAGKVNPYGYVAFVDEAIHHATPWFGHRYITPEEFGAYLAREHKRRWDAITRADSKSKGVGGYFWSLEDYVDKKVIPATEIDTWKEWLAMTRRKQGTRFTREDFKTTMGDDAFDLMLENIGKQPGAERSQAGIGGWTSASIPGAGGSKGHLARIRPKGRPPLRRQASSADFTKDLPEQLPQDVPRRFLRCWVRAVPEEFAARLRGG